MAAPQEEALTNVITRTDDVPQLQFYEVYFSHLIVSNFSDFITIIYLLIRLSVTQSCQQQFYQMFFFGLD